MLGIDLSGKRALVVGVADDHGFGFAIAKQLAEAGASICVGTWPPAYGVFTKSLKLGRLDASLGLERGGRLEIERIYAIDVAYDTLEETPAEVRENRRYKPHPDFTVQGVADQIVADFGEQPLDVVVHSVAFGSEVKNPLLQTSRRGYLEALSNSAFSFVAMVQRFGPLLRQGGSFLCLSYAASQRVVPFYAGGMSSSKAALESDTRLLAFEAGRRFGARVNCISAGPLASRAASSIGLIELMIEHSRQNAPLPEILEAAEVGRVAAFLLSPLASGITGSTIYVDKGLHAMGPASGSISQPDES